MQPRRRGESRPAAAVAAASGRAGRILRALPTDHRPGESAVADGRCVMFDYVPESMLCVMLWPAMHGMDTDCPPPNYPTTHTSSGKPTVQNEYTGFTFPTTGPRAVETLDLDQYVRSSRPDRCMRPTGSPLLVSRLTLHVPMYVTTGSTPGTATTRARSRPPSFTTTWPRASRC